MGLRGSWVRGVWKWRARASPSSVVTARFSTRSVLLPTSTTTTSLPRSARTSSIQRVVFTNEAWSAQWGKAAE